MHGRIRRNHGLARGGGLLLRLVRQLALLGAHHVQVGHDGESQLAGAFVVQRGDAEYTRRLDIEAETVVRLLFRPAIGFKEGGHRQLALVRRQHIHLVQHQPARLTVQLLVVLLQFLDDGARLAHRINVRIKRSHVHHVQQQARALQMLEEAVTQTGAFRRAFNQPRNIRDHKAAGIVHPHHAQVGMQRGERIIRHLGTRRRHRADKGGLARVGHAQQAHVRQHLQLQLQSALLALLARRALARRAVGGGFEMDVAQAALAAARNHDALAVVGQVRHQLARVVVGNHRAHRHLQFDIVAALAVAIGAATAFSVFRQVFFDETELHQSVDVFIRHRVHAAALAAVAAVRAAEGNELLSAETGHAVAAAAREHFNAGFINKLHVFNLCLARSQGSGLTRFNPHALPLGIKKALSQDRAFSVTRKRKIIRRLRRCTEPH